MLTRMAVEILARILFNTTAPTEIYTLSLHDALPISTSASSSRPSRVLTRMREAPSITCALVTTMPRGSTIRPEPSAWARSEEHTSELQSQSNLVCRLLLEKKKEEILEVQPDGKDTLL